TVRPSAAATRAPSCTAPSTTTWACVKSANCTSPIATRISTGKASAVSSMAVASRLLSTNARMTALRLTRANALDPGQDVLEHLGNATAQRLNGSHGDDRDKGGDDGVFHHR